MKKSIVLVAMCMVLSLTTQKVFSQGDSSNVMSVKPIIELGYVWATSLEEKYPNLAIIKFEFDMVFDESYTYINLNEGTEYFFGAFSDDRIADISLIVYKSVDGQWVEIKRDDEQSNTVYVNVTPSVTGMYAIDIKINKYAVETDTHMGHYGLFVAVNL